MFNVLDFLCWHGETYRHHQAHRGCAGRGRARLVLGLHLAGPVSVVGVEDEVALVEEQVVDDQQKQEDGEDPSVRRPMGGGGHEADGDEEQKQLHAPSHVDDDHGVGVEGRA